jgi:hypothetical protein
MTIATQDNCHLGKLPPGTIATQNDAGDERGTLVFFLKNNFSDFFP